VGKLVDPEIVGLAPPEQLVTWATPPPRLDEPQAPVRNAEPWITTSPPGGAPPESNMRPEAKAGTAKRTARAIPSLMTKLGLYKLQLDVARAGRATPGGIIGEHSANI